MTDEMIERKEEVVIKLICKQCHNQVTAGQIDPATWIVFCPKCKWAEFKTTEEMKKLQEVDLKEPE